jgi:hypothetical protein
VTAAIVGLLGVLVGGVLTGAIEFSLDRRRDSKAARVASLLLADDLAWSYGVLELILKSDRWLPRPGKLTRISTVMWEEQRLLLGTTISSADWMALAAAAHQLQIAEVMIYEDVKPGDPITDEERQALENVKDHLRHATAILRRYADWCR